MADAVFIDVTAAAGLSGLLSFDSSYNIAGFSAGDLNNDGHLDLFIPLWSAVEGQPDLSVLLINDVIGGFSDATDGSGLDDTQDRHWQQVMHDFTGDGNLGFFAAIDFTANRFWINQGGLTFADETPASGTDRAANDMGVALGDVDNDGDFYLYVTNVNNNALYRNNSSAGLIFNDVALAAGVEDGDWG